MNTPLFAPHFFIRLCTVLLSALTVAQAAAAPESCESLQQSQWRDTVLAQVNRLRSLGISCGKHGSFAPAPPLVWGEALVGIAQSQALAMAKMGELTHHGLQGEGLANRAQAGGYAFVRVAENLANGWQRTNELINDWADSDDHCVNLMDPRLREFALACTSDSHQWPWWVMTLGLPR